ncbi:MAG: hypothetical protein AAFV53_43840, partial [Myxococcota bacterium]
MIGVVLPFLIGCGSDSPPSSEAADIVSAEDWCEGSLGGPSAARPLMAGWAAAHVGLRMFGPETDQVFLDTLLADAVDGAVDSDALATYAESIDDVCLVTPQTDAAPMATVEDVQGWSWVTPGEGAVTLPADTMGMVLDLRGAPMADWDQLLAAVGPALGEDVSLGSRTVRSFNGFPSQLSVSNIYTVRQVEQPITVPATGAADLPILVVAPAALGPDAARMAAGLRIARRAWLFGADVHAAVAESVWTPIGDQGLLWRGMSLHRSGDLYPDRIASDDAGTPKRFLQDPGVLETPTRIDGDAMRSSIEPYDPVQEYAFRSTRVGDQRAAMMVAHGILDWFYPYFEVVGHTIDDALEESLTALDAGSLEPASFEAVLGRFMHSIEDGHGFFGHLDAQYPTARYDVTLQLVDGQTLVRQSSHDELLIGDVVVEIDGVPAADWYAEATARYSAASEGYLHNLATRELCARALPVTVRHPDGQTETVSPTPLEPEDMAYIGMGTLRPSGFLDDLGAPGIFLLNMHGSVTTDHNAVIDDLKAIRGVADGLIVDMRNYPGADFYS